MITQEQQLEAAQQPERRLRDALELLETALLTPVVAGEVGAWCDGVVKGWLPAADQVRQHFFTVHEAQYKEIAEQDPEMLPRVEQLRAGDQCLLEQLDRFDRHITKIRQVGDGAKPPETALQPVIDLLVDEGTSLIVELKKQLVAVQTWYGEAFNRDRGIGD